MGMYDTVMVPCPECGIKSDFQTKSGDCRLAVYELNETPADVLYDVNRHSPATCGKCGTKYGVKFEIYPAKVKSVASVKWEELQDDEDED